MHKYIASHIAVLVMIASFGAHAQQILVFTDSRHPVFSAPQQARIIELDKVSHIETSLSDGLNKDRNPSAELARARLNRHTHHQLADAYQGVVDAWTLGIEKIPAIVVDRQYVIYGEPDVGKAVSRIQTYRKERQ